MKKLLALVLACVMLFSFASCNDELPSPNGGGTTNDGGTTGETEGDENTSTPSATNPATDFEYVKTDFNDIAITGYLGIDEHVAIPDKIENLPVAYISFSAFYGTDIETVSIPNTVHTIKDTAFADCRKLVSVDFGKNVRIIEYSAFQNCTALQKIILPPNLESIGKGAFYGCSSVTEIFIPKSVKEWGGDFSKGTFAECTSLKALTFEEGLEQIGCWATFMGSESLEFVEIPASVKKIAPLAFNCCPSLTTVVFKGDVPQATEGSIKNSFGYEGDHDNLIIQYSPIASGWDTVVWRDMHQLQPLV